MSTSSLRIGLMSFSDGRKRVHDGLAPSIDKHQDRLEKLIEKSGAEPVVASKIAYTPRLAVAQAKRLLAKDIAAVVFNVPVFAFPNLSALAAAVLRKPVAILSPGESRLPGMGGMLAAGGALHQMGVFHERIWGPYTSAETRKRLGVFIRAAGAVHRLRGQVYGQIGGRSIGMATGVSSSSLEWLRVFGVDIDHADESEILRIAETIPDKERERIVSWLEKNLRNVAYEDGSKLTKENLKYQAACAAAVKKIAAGRQFDFVGIKCHYDMSEYYCTQCLSAAFLPSRQDWDGDKEPVACACEADGDGAISMEILRLITGKPTLFLDLRHYDTSTGLWTMCNCGGQSTYYATRSNNPGTNLKEVDLVPVIPKYGGVGAHVAYVGCNGPLTFCRVMHDQSQPTILAFRGEAVEAKEEWVRKSCPRWPHLFVSTDVQPGTLLGELHANHVHAVEGDCMDEIETFARIVGIPFVRL